MTVTTMRILGWKVEGLRCPDHEINCCKSNDATFPITLIQMPNGTGKTTTLTLLRAALSGVAGEWKEDQVQEMKKKESSDEEGLFELYLMLDDKRITIRMDFYFDSNRVFYKTTRGSGQQEGFNPPPDLRRFMEQEFVDFYIFDGELAKNLLNHEKTHAEIAIERLFQIHLLNRMKKEVSEYWKKQTQSSTSKDERGYKRRRNLLDKWQARLKELEKKKHELSEKLTETEENLVKQEKRYKEEIAKDENYEEDIKNAKEKEKELQSKIKEHEKLVLDKMREPHALSPVFANEVVHLKEKLDRLKLPESAAREFFEDLSEEEECVCGREVNQQIRQIILERSKLYLGTEDVNLLSAMKSTISNAVDESREKSYKELEDHVQTLSTLVADRESAENELNALEHVAAQSDPDIGKAKEEILRLENEKLSIINELRRFDGRDENFQVDEIHKENPSRIWAIKTIMEGIAAIEKQIEEITNTLNLRSKRDALEEILTEAYNKAREIITEEICKDTNERFAEIMPNNDISIEKIEKCLKLQGQIKGSEGETLSLGYAFLSTLFSRADQHQLPFVVDSPCGAIDLEKRKNIGEIVPKLASQFIAFMTSSERVSFLESMKKYGNTEIQYLTLFRKNASHFIDGASTVEKTETMDGLLIKDEKFFEEFQIEKDYPNGL